MSTSRWSPQLASFRSHLSGLDLLYRSPALILTALALWVAGSNALVAVFWAKPAQASLLHFAHHLLDSLVLVALLFPALVVLVFRPIRLHLEKRRTAEGELAAERNKLTRILDAMPTGVYIVNRDREIEWANAALVEEFGVIEGRRCHEYFHDLGQPCPSCKIDEVFGGRSSTWETVAGARGNVYEIFDTPLPNTDGTYSKLSIVRNITARKVAEYELRASRQQLRSLSAHLQRTREEERKAVSREIHDELGQVLATVQLGVSSLAEDRDRRRLLQKIAGMEQLVAGAIGTVQKIATQLRPSILDELGLAEAIEWQAAEFRSCTGIDLTTDILLPQTRFSSNVATAVFRIFQEALTNVMRHAAATRVSATFEQRNARVVLIVSDNGRGITQEQLRRRNSFGITGMRERAYALGGRVRIYPSRQQGTVVVAHIPVVTPGAEP